MRYLLLLAACLAGGTATAQTTLADKPAAAAPVVSPTHQQAAEALLGIMYTDASFNQLIEQAITTQLVAHPEIKPYEPEMRSFFQKYMSWAVMKPQMAAVYVREFSELELRELTRFYQSPVGHKAMTKLPMLMQAGSEIGQRNMREHLPELTKMIQDKAAASQN